MLVGFLGAVSGDRIGRIGRIGGRRLVLRIHQPLRRAHRDSTEQSPSVFRTPWWQDRRGSSITDSLRQFNGIVAGVVNMSWWRFLAFNALGAILWSTVWSGVGYFAGRYINAIHDMAERYQAHLLIALVFIVS